MNTDDIITGIDVGTTKIVVTIAKKEDNAINMIIKS